jgi:hypothetical protein
LKNALALSAGPSELRRCCGSVTDLFYQYALSPRLVPVRLSGAAITKPFFKQALYLIYEN